MPHYSIGRGISVSDDPIPEGRLYFGYFMQRQKQRQRQRQRLRQRQAERLVKTNRETQTKRRGGRVFVSLEFNFPVSKNHRKSARTGM